MKRLLIFLFFISFYGNSQNYQDIERGRNFCGSLAKSFASERVAEDALGRILSVFGEKRNFVVQQCDNVSNAVATVLHPSTIRYIFYRKGYLEDVNSNYPYLNTKYWSNMFVLAHEVGHHIKGHFSEGPDTSIQEAQMDEFEADNYATSILFHLGATLSQTVAWTNNMLITEGDYDDSYDEHPTYSRRKSAIIRAYNSLSNSTPRTPKSDNTDVADMYITANDIVLRYLERIGGLEKLKSIETMFVEGKTKFQEYEMEYLSVLTKPNKFANKISLKIDGNTNTLTKIIFNGTKGVMLSDFQKPIYFKPKDNKIYSFKSMPIEEINWINNSKIAFVTMESGSKEYAIYSQENQITYFDANTGLITRKYELIDKETGLAPIPGKETTSTYTFYYDYKVFNGILLPSRFKLFTQDGTTIDFSNMNYMINPAVSKSNINSLFYFE